MDDDLRELLKQCEDDTREILGFEAGQRLSNWRRYKSERDLVEYVQRLIFGPKCENGRKLRDRGKLSVEEIVLRLPDLFTKADQEQAKRTLRISK